MPVFNDKHLSYNWADAKWMFDKSRELNFPLNGGAFPRFVLAFGRYFFLFLLNSFAAQLFLLLAFIVISPR